MLTLPVTLPTVVMAKFLAAWAFVAVALALTFPMVLTTYYLGSPDGGVKGVSEVSVSRGDDEGMMTYHVFPEQNRPILQEVIHFLEKKKVSTEALASEPGRVDEVFRDVTQEPF